MADFHGTLNKDVMEGLITFPEMENKGHKDRVPIFYIKY